ncbi:MAG: cytoplasmic protein [Desulfuromonas sp.]|uniref:DUF362 domain-containing protein n=1 Tax=Desulfuromonas sp. TaxID=892 RepID=UPI000CB65650|nr:DUF362 domain-containing protein [Desulfuromonas sp.]PLX83966.1 MAG: cytoplasmic protein [Desulfuromonas sp.]
MDRRRFLKEVALWTAGLSLAVPRFMIPTANAATPQSALAVATGKDYGALTARVLEPLGGITAFVKPGEAVVIKPNIGWDRTPEQGANTHPLVVAALARLSLEAGAKEVKVFDRTCNEERRCYQRSGIRPALLALDDGRVRCEYIDGRKFVPVDIVKGKSINRWKFYGDALEADCYINVPVAKHHGLSALSLGLKNTMGVIGGNRGKIHQDIGQKLADLGSVVRPRLTVIDATRLLLRNGPQGGDVNDVKINDMLIASADPVAADAYATTLFGMNPDAITSTVAAHGMGLGQIDLTKVKIDETAL